TTTGRLCKTEGAAPQVADLDSYFRGKSEASVVNRALADAQKQAWFAGTYLGNEVPDKPKLTKWYQQMDFDPVPVWRQVRTPIIFFFGEKDRWVPVDESIKRIKEAMSRNPRLTIKRLKEVGHFMNQNNSDDEGPVSTEYLNEMLNWIRDRR